MGNKNGKQNESDRQEARQRGLEMSKMDDNGWSEKILNWMDSETESVTRSRSQSLARTTGDRAKTKNIQAMDWKNLIEEIEDLNASQKRALKSYMRRLIEYLLKLEFWHSKHRCHGQEWRNEIINLRIEIESILEDSPSLKNFLEQNYAVIHSKAVESSHRKEEFELPQDCFVPLRRALDKDFFPEDCRSKEK